MDHLEIVHRQTLDLLTFGKGRGEYRERLIAEKEAWTARYLSGQADQLEPADWEDVDIGNKVAHRARDLHQLAEGYVLEGCRFAGDPEVRQRLLNELDHLLDYFNPETPRPGNWHPWYIQTTQYLGALGLLLEDALPDVLMDRLLAALRHELVDLRLNGANAAWEARNHAYLALLDRDTDRLEQAAAHVFRPVRYAIDNGVLEDFSYSFHGRIPYAGAYGAGFAETVAQFLVLFDGTQWAAVPEKRDLLAQFLLHHALWFVHRGYLDPHIVGRVYERHYRADKLTEATLLMTAVETPFRMDLEAAARDLIAEGAPISNVAAPFADGLGIGEERDLTGFRYWYGSEMGAYKGNGFHVGFRQYSKRMQDYEYLNYQGPEGWNLGYGFAYLTRDGTEWFRSGSLRAEIDMERLPATTTRLGVHPVNERGDRPSRGHSLNFGTSGFSGGAGWDTGGVGGFILVPANGDFIAHKSLHFFPQGYWALGSGIFSTARMYEDRPVITPILQWPVDGDKAVRLSNGERIQKTDTEKRTERLEWLHFDRIGIAFARPTEVRMEIRDGILNVWLDHGPHPQNERYAYAVLPEVSLRELVRFIEEARVKPVQHTLGQHIVRDTTRRADSAVFFEPGTWQDLETLQPLVLYRELSADGSVYAVQDPLYRNRPIRFQAQLPGAPRLTEPALRIASAQGERATLEVDTVFGRVYRFGSGPKAEALEPYPRVDLSDLHAFTLQAEHTPEATFLSVTLPESVRDAGYELSIAGYKGHFLLTLEDEHRVRENPPVYTYRWDREPHPDPTAPEVLLQRTGDFRLYLRTPMGLSVRYFTVPVFRPDGSVDPDAELFYDSNQHR